MKTVPLPPQYNSEEGSANSFCKELVTILGFVRHTVAVATINSASEHKSCREKGVIYENRW